MANLLCEGSQFALQGLLCLLFVLHLLLQMINVASQRLGFVVGGNLVTSFLGQLFLWEEREEGERTSQTAHGEFGKLGHTQRHTSSMERTDSTCRSSHGPFLSIKQRVLHACTLTHLHLLELRLKVLVQAVQCGVLAVKLF